MMAGVISLAIFGRAMAGVTRRELAGGALIGATIFLGYGLQTFGLQTITSSQSAFITALYVPIVPLLEWLVLRRRPRLMSWVGIGLAFAGLLLVAGPVASSTAEPGVDRLSFGPGEVATLIGAVAIAAEILLIGRFAGETDSRRITVVQLLSAGVLSLLVMPLAGESAPPFAWGWAAPAFALGIASAGIQLTMNWAQRAVSPTRATVIYAGEPVWGGIVGRLAGERLPPSAGVGAALIVAGVLASELKGRTASGATEPPEAIR